jgi:hypothetical protein
MGKQISEFDGTGSAANGGGGGAGIDPASLAPGGAGADAGSGGADGSDDFERDNAGNIVRNKDGSPRRKRGRRGSGGGGGSSATRKASNKDDLKRSIDALSNMLLISHMGISGAINVPELALEKDDADLLANGIVPVLDQFDFTPDPRFVAVFGMFAAMGKVYGPKVYLYRNRVQAEKDARMKRAGSGSTVGE